MPAELRFPAATATLVALAVILALAVLGVLVLGGGKAAAVQQPSCGDTITSDATLHHNLVNCPNNGILIGADNVTLDLHYHTIDGDGTPAPGCDPQQEFCDEGIVDDGHDGVAVVNGSVRQFDVGADVIGARQARLLGITASMNDFIGIRLFESSRSLVQNSSGSDTVCCRASAGTGMFLVGSHHVRVLRNSFRNNGDQGIFVASASHNLIKRNRTSRNKGLAAIFLSRANRNQVRRNRSVRDRGIGIADDGHRNVIARNRIARAAQAIAGGFGRHNVIAHNSIRNTEGDAITIGLSEVVGSVVRRNHIRGAGEDGVHVMTTAKRTRLGGNRVRHSKDDGIDVENRRTKLTKNRALRNRDLGIEAVRGVIDGGGNVARHNGDQRQCTHIACS
jgi:parallel beta-helix repeat protein